MLVRTRVLLIVATVVAVGASMVAPAAAASWHFGTLDGATTAQGRVNGDVGQYTSTILYDSTPHTFYRDVQNGTLRHAWWTGTTWAYQTLDGGDTSKNISKSGGDVGTDVKAVIFEGQPHVFYYDVGNGNLKHAWWTGAKWAFQVMDGSGSAVSGRSSDTGTDLSILSYGAGPHLFYYDVTNHSLRHAWWTGAVWGFQTLDGAGGISGSTNDTGQYTSALLYGAPHVFYYDDTDTVLRHAWWTGTQWGFQTLDGQGVLPGQVNASVGSDTSAAMYGGTPHVWYYDISSGDLRHAWWTGATWAYQTLDGAGGTDVGTYTVVSMYGGTPHVFYRDETNGNLRQAWWNGQAWILETLDGSSTQASSQVEGDFGLDASTTVYLGQLQVIYYDAGSGNLRQAWYG
jgi:hypothetical protein